MKRCMEPDRSQGSVVELQTSFSHFLSGSVMNYRNNALAVLFCLAASSSFAAGGTGEYELDWPIAGETLAYRSCGCGDSCWVAEVRDKASEQPRAALSCDCEQLFYAPAGGQKQPLNESCEAINLGADKAALIGSKLQQLRKQGE